MLFAWSWDQLAYIFKDTLYQSTYAGIFAMMWLARDEVRWRVLAFVGADVDDGMMNVVGIRSACVERVRKDTLHVTNARGRLKWQ